MIKHLTFLSMCAKMDLVGANRGKLVRIEVHLQLIVSVKYIVNRSYRLALRFFVASPTQIYQTRVGAPCYVNWVLLKNHPT